MEIVSPDVKTSLETVIKFVSMGHSAEDALQNVQSIRLYQEVAIMFYMGEYDCFIRADALTQALGLACICFKDEEAASVVGPLIRAGDVAARDVASAAVLSRSQWLLSFLHGAGLMDAATMDDIIALSGKRKDDLWVLGWILTKTAYKPAPWKVWPAYSDKDWRLARRHLMTDASVGDDYVLFGYMVEEAGGFVEAARALDV